MLVQLLPFQGSDGTFRLPNIITRAVLRLTELLKGLLEGRELCFQNLERGIVAFQLIFLGSELRDFVGVGWPVEPEELGEIEQRTHVFFAQFGLLQLFGNAV